MLFLVAGTYQLVVWSRNYDPRFYHFLSTAPGRTLSRVMNWPSLYNQPPHDRPLSEFTAEELAWKRTLEANIQQNWPTHRLLMRNGDEHLGRLLRSTPASLRFEQAYGGQGRISREFDRAHILTVEPFDQPPPSITWRDVRFQMEFPEFQLIHFGHYTVVTDAPFYQVIESVRTLERVYQQYMELFGGLVSRDRPPHGLQVVFFNSEEQFRRHQLSEAPGLETSAGFYSPLHDRMVVFNQYNSQHAQEMRQEIQLQLDHMLSRSRNDGQRRSILEMREQVEEQLRARGRRETIATLRHEGAHHLSYSFGIHSWHHAENGWLIEGIAVYFESDPPGGIPPGHAGTLANLLSRNDLPPLARLMAIRRPDDFTRDLPGFSAYEAYLLSWGLFHFGMLPENRTQFFDYLRFLRAPENLREIVRSPAIDLLARHLEMTPEALERAWLRHMHRMLRQRGDSVSSSSDSLPLSSASVRTPSRNIAVTSAFR